MWDEVQKIIKGTMSAFNAKYGPQAGSGKWRDFVQLMAGPSVPPSPGTIWPMTYPATPGHAAGLHF